MQQEKLPEPSIPFVFEHEECKTPRELLESPKCRRVIEMFRLYRLRQFKGETVEDDIRVRILKTFSAQRLLDLLDGKIQDQQEQELLNDFVQEIVNFWADRCVRIMKDVGDSDALEDQSLRLQLLIHQTRRAIQTRVYGTAESDGKLRTFNVAPHLALSIDRPTFALPRRYHHVLGSIQPSHHAVIRTPTDFVTAKNKRSIPFEELPRNPFEGNLDSINPNEWTLLPLDLGGIHIAFYIHRNRASLLPGMANLFAQSHPKNMAGKKPDGIVMFGVPSQSLPEKQQAGYWIDEEEGIPIGFAANSEEFDYFGYAKKLTLTVHNIAAMLRGEFPFHCAACRILVKGQWYTVVMAGDSRTGKSETAEHLRKILGNDSVQIIVDDMARFDAEAMLHGLEIGGFVCLEDLPPDIARAYARRGVGYNKHMRMNSRTVAPFPRLNAEMITQGWRPHLVLYLNNYIEPPSENRSGSIEIFTDPQPFIHIAERGARVAKGSTQTAAGEMEFSYHFNPFPVLARVEATQEKDGYRVTPVSPRLKAIADDLLKKLLDRFQQKGIPFGVAYSELAIPGKELTGPTRLAHDLHTFLNTH